MQEQQSLKRRQLNWRLVAVVMVVLWGLVIAGGIGYFVHNKNALKKQDPTEQAKEITTKVAKIYLVPTTEKPTVAEIKDVSKLAGQQFYGQARNGDYLLLYPEQKLAIIYRESSNKLINVAPISTPNRNDR